MRVIAVLLSGFLGLATCGAVSPELPKVQSVYLFPMANGLDQYLANRLTNMGVFQVVTDPKRADAVFTDRLGAAFEDRLGRLFPLPEAVKPELAEASQKVEAKQEEGAKVQDKDEPEPQAKEEKQAAEPPRTTSFSRAKGTVFLVNAAARTVVWSVYERPRNTSAAEMDRIAGRIAEALKRELSRK